MPALGYFGKFDMTASLRSGIAHFVETIIDECQSYVRWGAIAFYVGVSATVILASASLMPLVHSNSLLQTAIAAIGCLLSAWFTVLLARRPQVRFRPLIFATAGVLTASLIMLAHIGTCAYSACKPEASGIGAGSDLTLVSRHQEAQRRQVARDLSTKHSRAIQVESGVRTYRLIGGSEKELRAVESELQTNSAAFQRSRNSSLELMDSYRRAVVAPSDPENSESEAPVVAAQRALREINDNANDLLALQKSNKSLERLTSKIFVEAVRARGSDVLHHGRVSALAQNSRVLLSNIRNAIVEIRDEIRRDRDFVRVSTLTCNIVARVPVSGNAYRWWMNIGLSDKERRLRAPVGGAVMVIADYFGSNRAHVAVVRRIVSSREIRVDHSNFLNSGRVDLDDPVADVSPNNDWSEILVWNLQTNSWGMHVFNVVGFVGPRDADATNDDADVTPDK